MYKVKLDKRVQKKLSRLSKDYYLRASEAIWRLADFPSGDIKLLKGKHKGLYRLRVGPFRVLFQLREGAKEIIVFRFDTRGDIY